MSRPLAAPRTRRTPVLLGTLALLAALIVVPPAFAGADCGPLVDVDDLTRGQQATGLTVVSGTEPEPFDVEVLGVLENGVGVGRDMIIVEVSAPFIDDASGIWQGMSGSPVYDEAGALIGAVAFGLAGDSSGIGGLTPAQDLVDLVDLPSGFAMAPVSAEEIVVTGDLAAEIQRRVGADGSSAFAGSSVTMAALAVPFSVSGLGADRLGSIQSSIDDAGFPMRAVGGSSADFAQVPTTSNAPDAGENLAVAFSYGDVTSAAIGTTTLNCDGFVVGFGHPFVAAGETVAGGSTADAITIVPDETFAPFKLANVGRLFGVVDQDRFAGVRADIGARPDFATITSTVTDLDTGRTRDGRSDVVRPESIPDIAAFHVLGNIDSVIDRFGPGTSEMTFTVTGSGEESGAFAFTRDNVFASQFDVAFETIFEMLDTIFLLQSAAGEEVDIDAVRVEASVEREVEAYTIVAARATVDGGEPIESFRETLFVEPGSIIEIEVDLEGVEDSAELTLPLTLEVPAESFGGGFLDITGGFQSFFSSECAFFPEACEQEGSTQLETLLDELAAAPRNDEVVATLFTDSFDPGEPGPTPEPTEGPEGPPEPAPPPTAEPTPEPAPPGEASAFASDDDADGRQRDLAQLGDQPQATAQADRVVTGFAGFEVVVNSDLCPSCSPFFVRAAGSNRIETSVALANQAPLVQDTVVIAPAGDYPSALIAGPLAAPSGAPILLAADTGLDPSVASYIRSLGITRAIIVAPDGQLGVPVELDLTASGITTIERIGGADRYAVAAGVAARIGGSRAWLVEGENADPSRGWPDAMSVGPLASTEGVPILLTRSGDLPQTTADTITAMGISDISIGGGTVAVSEGVEAAVQALGVTTERLAGATRYETSVLMADRQIELGAFDGSLFLVTGRAFPDGLAAAPVVASGGSVMLMVDGQDIDGSPAARQFIADRVFRAPTVTFVGGFAAISQAVEEQVFALLTNQLDG